MESVGLIFNVSALVASFAALAVSLGFSLWQSQLMRASNQLPVVIEFFNECRSDEFLKREWYIWENLPDGHDPTLGFVGMPEPLRTYMYSVCVFYQNIAYLVDVKVFDGRLAYRALHYRVIRTWTTVEPFVIGERARRGARETFLNALEDWVESVRREDRKRLTTAESFTSDQ